MFPSEKDHYIRHSDQLCPSPLPRIFWTSCNHKNPLFRVPSNWWSPFHPYWYHDRTSCVVGYYQTIPYSDDDFGFPFWIWNPSIWYQAPFVVEVVVRPLESYPLSALNTIQYTTRWGIDRIVDLPIFFYDPLGTSLNQLFRVSIPKLIHL